jgi:hypothetical protein
MRWVIPPTRMVVFKRINPRHQPGVVDIFLSCFLRQHSSIACWVEDRLRIGNVLRSHFRTTECTRGDRSLAGLDPPIALGVDEESRREQISRQVWWSFLQDRGDPVGKHGHEGGPLTVCHLPRQQRLKIVELEEIQLAAQLGDGHLGVAG